MVPCPEGIITDYRCALATAELGRNRNTNGQRTLPVNGVLRDPAGVHHTFPCLRPTLFPECLRPCTPPYPCHLYTIHYTAHGPGIGGSGGGSVARVPCECDAAPDSLSRTGAVAVTTVDSCVPRLLFYNGCQSGK